MRVHAFILRDSRTHSIVDVQMIEEPSSSVKVRYPRKLFCQNDLSEYFVDDNTMSMSDMFKGESYLELTGPANQLPTIGFAEPEIQTQEI